MNHARPNCFTQVCTVVPFLSGWPPATRSDAGVRSLLLCSSDLWWFSCRDEDDQGRLNKIPGRIVCSVDRGMRWWFLPQTGRGGVERKRRCYSSSASAKWIFDSLDLHVRWETPRGRYDAVQQQVFPQYETKVYRTSRSSSASEGCQRRNMMRRNTRESGTDVETAHNTNKLLCPNETVRLSISLAC